MGNWSLIEATGKDVERFLQGQLTSDVSALASGETQLSARVDRKGRVQSYFYLHRRADGYILIIPEDLALETQTDLEKYVVMDDVCLRVMDSGLEMDSPIGKRINETFLNERAVSYTKGCFLGQEVVAKSESNKLKRVEKLYTEAIAEFQANREEEAIGLLEQVLELRPNHPEALESLGVILGRLGRYEEGITRMNQLAKVDPNSVMAHTNKSLFLMKLGRIEEAEEEKAQATVKSFGAAAAKAQTPPEK